MSTLLENLRAWLNGHGYPLEMEVARAMVKEGFGVVQSEYFEDKEEKKWRETDVIGYDDAHGESARIVSATVVECKSGKEKPWVLFTASDPYPKNLSVARRATCERGESVLRSLALNPEARNSTAFAVPERPAYSLQVAHTKDGSDPAYSALTSVAFAANGVVSRLAKASSILIPIAWPVIVIEAPLVECFLDSDDQLQLAEVDCGLLIWRNPVVRTHTFIEVSRKERFIASLPERRESIKRVLELMAEENDRSPR